MESTAPVRRRRRPRVENPQVDRRVVRFTEAEGRRLNALMHRRGVSLDNEILRDLILAALDKAGIEDPGPDSPEAILPPSPRRKISTLKPEAPKSQQGLLLTA